MHNMNINDHTKRNHWKLIERSRVPDGKNILPAVWSMKRKRDIKTRKVIKYKARLNIHGGKQVFGEDYVLVTHCIPALKRPCAH